MQTFDVERTLETREEHEWAHVKYIMECEEYQISHHHLQELLLRCSDSSVVAMLCLNFTAQLKKISFGTGYYPLSDHYPLPALTVPWKAIYSTLEVLRLELGSVLDFKLLAHFIVPRQCLLIIDAGRLRTRRLKEIEDHLGSLTSVLIYPEHLHLNAKLDTLATLLRVFFSSALPNPTGRAPIEKLTFDCIDEVGQSEVEALHLGEKADFSKLGSVDLKCFRKSREPLTIFLQSLRPNKTLPITFEEDIQEEYRKVGKSLVE